MSSQDVNEGTAFSEDLNLLDSSTSQLGSRKAKTVGAQEGEPAHFQVTGRASASGRFSYIRWGLFRRRPAVFICIDVQIAVQHVKIRNLGFGVEFRNRISEHVRNTELPDAFLYPRITEKWGPSRIDGPGTSVKEYKRVNLQITVGGGPFSITTPEYLEERHSVRNQCWQLRGRPATAKGSSDHGFRDLNWVLRGHGSDTSTLPDQFTFWAIVEHGGQPFTMKFKYDGLLQESGFDLVLRAKNVDHCYTFSPQEADVDLEDIELEVRERCLGLYGHT